MCNWIVRGVSRGGREGIWVVIYVLLNDKVWWFVNIFIDMRMWVLILFRKKVIKMDVFWKILFCFEINVFSCVFRSFLK